MELSARHAARDHPLGYIVGVDVGAELAGERDEPDLTKQKVEAVALLVLLEDVLRERARLVVLALLVEGDRPHWRARVHAVVVAVAGARDLHALADRTLDVRDTPRELDVAIAVAGSGPQLETSTRLEFEKRHSGYRLRIGEIDLHTREEKSQREIKFTLVTARSTAGR